MYRQNLFIFDKNLLQVMPVIFPFKRRLRNINNLFICILFSLLFSTVNAQNIFQNNVDIKNEKSEKEVQQINESKYKKLLKHQFQIQTKNVQKRMKENEKMTNKFYRRGSFNRFFQKLFGHKKLKKAKICR